MGLHRSLAVLAATAQVGMAANPACATFGTGYDDLNVQRLNGAFLPDAQACQASCQSTVFCDTFTWYNDTGGCWLQGNNVTTITNKFAVSGPKFCPGDAGAAVTISDKTDKTTKMIGGFPWWGWVLAGLGVAGVGSGIACVFCVTSGKTKKSSKRGTNVAKDVESATPADAVPLMQSTEMGHMPVTTGAVYTAAPMYMPAGTPMYMPAAEPIYMQAAPQVMYAAAEPMYMQAAPQYAGTYAAAPQMMYTTAPAYATGADMFDRLDTDGSGYLSREELARMGLVQQ